MSIRILLVDDDVEKSQSVEDVIRECLGSTQCAVERVATYVDALEALETQQYDILVVDLKLPRDSGASAETYLGADLVRRLSDVNPRLRHPKYVVGLTAFPEGCDAFGEHFEQEGWDLLAYSSASEEWRRRLSRLLAHVSAAERDARSHDDEPVEERGVGSISEEPDTSLPAITLSGGGFRAALFHLGVLLFCLKNQLLGRNSIVVGVSGGAVVAAHFAVHHDAVLGACESGDLTRIKAFAERLMVLVRADLRSRVLRRWCAQWSMTLTAVLACTAVGITRWLGELRWEWSPSILCMMVGCLSIGVLGVWRKWSLTSFRTSAILEGEYRALLCEGATLGSMDKSTFLAATSLTNGKLVVAGNEQLAVYGSDGKDAGHSREAGMPLARLVAASSAFPPAFPPVAVKLTRRDGVDVHWLTDGGVFDNLGIHALRNTQRRKYNPGATKRPIVVSDASAPLQDTKSDHVVGFVQRNMRATELLMYRLAQADLRSDGDLLHLQMFATNEEDRPMGVGTGGSGAHISDAFQLALSSIRTDLNRFSDAEIACLVEHGARTARHRFSAQFPSESWAEVTEKEIATLCGLSQQMAEYRSRFESRARVHEGSTPVGVLIAGSRVIRQIIFGKDWMCAVWTVPLALLGAAVWQLARSFGW
jgi:predicted acylesterase/phospholipase RssA/CheY-like chemotaxis protein